ncbi:MAG: hypothetical protein ACW981_13880 [Candidatus Hodarchaeales archaeon]
MNKSLGKKFDIKNIKIAYRLVFFGMDSCITCALLYPLITMANKNELIAVVEPKIFSSKSDYRNYIQKLLTKYTDEFDSNIPVPLLLLQLKPNDSLKLVSPPVITEIAMAISDTLDSFEKMSFIDGETPLSIFFINQLHKMSSNLLSEVNDIN